MGLINSRKKPIELPKKEEKPLKKVETTTKGNENEQKSNLIDTKGKEKEEEENNLQKLPFEDFISTITNAEKWTAAFTITQVNGKQVRTLADTGATSSIVSLNWVKHFNLEHLVEFNEELFMSAQKSTFSTQGNVCLPVTFAEKEFLWNFKVAENLICPMILGLDILNTGSVNLKNRYVEIEGLRQPITITLGELKQATVMAISNRTIQPGSYHEIKGRIIKDSIIDDKLEPQTYILNAGGIVAVNQLVSSNLIKAEGARQISEYVVVRVFNKTQKKIQIKKGTIIATAESVSNETLSAIEEFTPEKARHNYVSLIQRLTPDTLSEKKKCIPSTHESITPIGKLQAETYQQNNKESVPHLGREEGVQTDPSPTVAEMMSPLDKGKNVCSNSTVLLGEGESDDKELSRTPSKDIYGIQDTQTRGGTSEGRALISPEMMVSNTLLEKGNLMQQNVVSGSDYAEMMQKDSPKTGLEHNWCQYPIDCKTGEDNSHFETPFVDAPIEQTCSLDSEGLKGKIDGITSPEINESSTPTVSELREEVLSTLQVARCKEALSDTLQPENGSLTKDKETKHQSQSGDECMSQINSLINNSENKDLDFESKSIEDIRKMANDTNCTQEEKLELEKLFMEYKEQFLPAFTQIFPAGKSLFQPHKINLKHNDPIWIPQFRQSEAEKKIIEEVTQAQFKSGVIEKSVSPYNSPCMCVPKKDGTWRPVIDYRVINNVTIKEQWPMTRSDEAYDALSNAKYMTKLDCTSGYWQIPLDPESRLYTAFTTSMGRWQYVTLPMGITNAAPTFQRSMEIMFTGILWKYVIVYIDDIIIYSNTFEEHIEHLKDVLARLKKANIVLKPSKCSVAQQEIEYLGHIVGKGLLKPMISNTTKVKEAKIPQTLTEVRSFCNLAGFYRKFIPNFAKVAKPLTDLMGLPGKKKRVELSEDAIKAFNILKEAICAEPVLNLPDISKPFGLRTDASDYAIGGVLFQLR